MPISQTQLYAAIRHDIFAYVTPTQPDFLITVMRIDADIAIDRVCRTKQGPAGLGIVGALDAGDNDVALIRLQDTILTAVDVQLAILAWIYTFILVENIW